MSILPRLLITLLTACTGQFAAGAGGPAGAAGPSGTSGNDPSGGPEATTYYAPPPGSANVPPPAGEQAAFGTTVAEQNAVTRTETELAEIEALVREKCGVPAFHVSVAWTDYLSLNDADFEGRSRDNVYGCPTSQIGDSLRQLASTCGDSAILRGSVQRKLASVIGHPRVGPVSAKRPSHVFTLEKGVLHVQYHFCTSNTSSDEMQKVF